MDNINQQINSAFTTMDTDYVPASDHVDPIVVNDTEEQFLLVLIPVTDDSYISIIKDNEANREMIKDMGITVVGSVSSKVKLSDLLYGLNHPYRVSFKSACGSFKQFIDAEYRSDDNQLRELFDNVN